MGCPIGMMQHFAATHKFPFYLVGFLPVIGLISGRFTYGWLCPWGFLVDVMYFFKRLPIRYPNVLNYLKYVVLIVLCIIIPYFTFEHWFSKLCPVGGLTAGIPWVMWNPNDPIFDSAVITPGQVGTLFWVMMWILGICLTAFIFIKRPFCRMLCPLGATCALFNRISLMSLKVQPTCTDCGRCRELCPMDLEFKSKINSENCIKCLDCTPCRHVEFKWNLLLEERGRIKHKGH